MGGDEKGHSMGMKSSKDLVTTGRDSDGGGKNSKRLRMMTPLRRGLGIRHGGLDLIWK